MKKITRLAVLALFLGTVPTYAQVIGINFYDSADSAAVQTLNPSDVAGAYSSAGWYNNVDVSGSAPSGVALTDSSNTATSAQFSIKTGGSTLNGNNTYYFTNSALNTSATSLTPTQTLFNGNVTTSNNSGYTTEFQLTGITYSSYSVYVYAITSPYNSGSAQIFSGGTAGGAGLTYFFTNGAPWYPGDTGNIPTSYTQVTGTTSDTATSGANYVLFSGLSGSTQYIDMNNGTVPGKSGSYWISGIEIVDTSSTAVPEPSTYAMLGFGGLMLVLLRRRQVRALHT